jgi:phosphatidylinositol-3-phosphatase
MREHKWAPRNRGILGALTLLLFVSLYLGDSTPTFAKATRSYGRPSIGFATTLALAPQVDSYMEAANPTATATPTRSGAGTRTKTPPPSRTASTTPSPTSGGSGSVPNFSHIYTILLENKEYGSIVGQSSAPYLNSLIARYGLATNYTATFHPSEPNYLALFSGSNQGVTDNGVHNLGAKNVADQIEASRRTWRVFAQNVPLNCYTGATASGGEDGSGSYARKHEPAISFNDINSSSSRCANISDFTHFDPAAANYEFIVPNLCNSMHDCSVATGDKWLKSFVPGILNSAAWQGGGVLFITWDEGSSSTGGGGHVATLVIANSVTAGFKSGIAHSHYSLLRTVQDAWGLGCLANSCSAKNMGEFFH